jgi:uncharacterized YccA/Bax inhibitor family protein
MEKAYRRLGDDYPPPYAKPYTAAGVYDKVGILVVLALVTGVYNYLVNNTALLLVGIVGGLVFSLVGIFKPHTAKFMAPLYALAEGLALGGITAFYAVGNTGIIPMAIIFTGGIFLAALVIFRTGLIRITPRFMAMAIMAIVGFFLVLLAQLFGLFSLNSSGGNLLIGVFGVLVGVLFLFIDFNFIQQSEQRQLPAEAEWSGALVLMTSLVFVYINVLRILGRRR